MEFETVSPDDILEVMEDVERETGNPEVEIGEVFDRIMSTTNDFDGALDFLMKEGKIREIRDDVYSIVR